jgi:hypothetical protein
MALWTGFEAARSTAGRGCRKVGRPLISMIGSIRRECVDHITFSWARCICARFCDRTHAITMTSGRIGHWTKMHRSLAKFSESEASNHTPSLADFTTTTPELFSVHNRPQTDCWTF